MVKDSEEILAELTKHYDSLYKRNDDAEESEIGAYLESAQIPKLDTSELQSLEKEITVEELEETLKRLSNNKSPGSDGFPYEFCKVFWCDLKYFVLKSLKYGSKIGELSITQREGIITLVPKPGKPRHVISSWRPITFLNSTYKILAGTFANRLKKVLDSIIHTDQTAFLKNRFISENIRATYDVLLETYAKNQEGLILSIDFKTTFDVMSWTFLECCLKKFNFGPNFIKTFWYLHTHCFSRIIYSGQLSRQGINLERGCRQGDPISCYFFIIGAEVLANRIRNSQTNKGIKIGQAESKLLQYADDTTFFLDGTEESIRAVFGELGWLAKYSGSVA